MCNFVTNKTAGQETKLCKLICYALCKGKKMSWEGRLGFETNQARVKREAVLDLLRLELGSAWLCPLSFLLLLLSWPEACA